jgi:hypothetical protein
MPMNKASRFSGCVHSGRLLYNPSQVKAFLQTEKSSLDNILFPVDEHCFFGVVDIVADDNPTCGFEFAAYDILGYLPFAKKL